MIETYKVLSGIYDTIVSPGIPVITVCYSRQFIKIANRRSHYNPMKYSFSIR